MYTENVQEDWFVYFLSSKSRNKLASKPRSSLIAPSDLCPLIVAMLFPLFLTRVTFLLFYSFHQTSLVVKACPVFLQPILFGLNYKSGQWNEKRKLFLNTIGTISVCIAVFMIIYSYSHKQNSLSPAGFEPATFGLEVQRAIHCATGTGFIACKRINFEFEIAYCQWHYIQWNQYFFLHGRQFRVNLK